MRMDRHAADIGALKGVPQACTTPPSGMVGWAFDGNPDDIHEVIQPLFGSPSFVAGKVQQSLSFDGVDDNANVPQSSAIDVGASDGLTIDAWINVPQTGTARPLIEWNNGAGIESTPLDVRGLRRRCQGGQFSLTSTDTLEHTTFFFRAEPARTCRLAARVAVTYDKTSGVAKICSEWTNRRATNAWERSRRRLPPICILLPPVGVLAGRRFLGKMDKVELRSIRC